MRYVSAFLSFLILSQGAVFAEPLALKERLKDKYSLTIEGYELDIKTAKKGARMRFSQHTILLDEFDYSLIHDTITGKELDCVTRVSLAKQERDRLCSDEKDDLRRVLSQQLRLCEDLSQECIREKQKLTEEISVLKEKHSSELFLHYTIESIGAVALIGLVVGIVMK